MRLTNKKIEEIMLSILGEEGLPLVKELSGKENVSEFDLATKIKKDIKIVRKLLYLLYNHNLIKFTRKKDKQKGWYIYYWTLIPENIRFNYFKRKKELLERLKHKINSENSELYFICPNNCVRLNFDQSVDFGFHCPECGELISQDDNKERVKKLLKDITLIEEELEKAKQQKTIKRKQIKINKKIIKARKVSKKRVVIKTIAVNLPFDKKTVTKKNLRGNIIEKKVSAKKKKIVTETVLIKKKRDRQVLKKLQRRNLKKIVKTKPIIEKKIKNKAIKKVKTK